MEEIRGTDCNELIKKVLEVEELKNRSKTLDTFEISKYNKVTK